MNDTAVEEIVGVWFDIDRLAHQISLTTSGSQLRFWNRPSSNFGRTSGETLHIPRYGHPPYFSQDVSFMGQ